MVDGPRPVEGQDLTRRQDGCGQAKYGIERFLYQVVSEHDSFRP